MTWMLRLYPRAWQKRYGNEVATLLESEDRSLRLFVDLFAGAIDARLNPQDSRATQTSGEKSMKSSLLRLCDGPSFPPADRMRGAAWMIGATLGFSLLGLALQRFFDMSLLSRTVLYAAFPMALILSSQSTYLKPYRRSVRAAMLAAGLAAMFGFFLAVTVLADRL